MPHGGASTFIQISTVGPREEGQYPTHAWDKIKIYLMIEVFRLDYEALFFF